MTSSTGDSCCSDSGNSSAIQHRAVSFRPPLPFLASLAAAAAAAFSRAFLSALVSSSSASPCFYDMTVLTVHRCGGTRCPHSCLTLACPRALPWDATLTTSYS